MKYVSVDLETTGLDPTSCQVLMVAMIVENTARPGVAVEDLPTFACYVRHPFYRGESIALAMNGKILEKLGSRDVFVSHKDLRTPVEIVDGDCWQRSAERFLDEHFPAVPVIAAGKNVAGFDLRFFDAALRSRFHHRTIDPGSLFVNWEEAAPPSLVSLKRRFEIDTPSAHDAVGDARDVIRVLRTKYWKSA